MMSRGPHLLHSAPCSMPEWNQNQLIYLYSHILLEIKLALVLMRGTRVLMTNFLEVEFSPLLKKIGTHICIHTHVYKCLKTNKRMVCKSAQLS